MIRGFIGPTGAGKNLSSTAWIIDMIIQAINNEITSFLVYSNYGLFNGDHNPLGLLPGIPTGIGTPLPYTRPLEDLAVIPDLSYCASFLTELPTTLGLDPRVTTQQRDLWKTRVSGNLRKSHVHFGFDAKDPESDVDKRFRTNINDWTSPMYAQDYDIIIECHYNRARKYIEAFDTDTILESAQEITLLENVSQYFPYYDTDELFDTYNKPYPLKDTALEFVGWLTTNKAPANAGTLAEFLTERNFDTPTSTQKAAILSRINRLRLA